MTAAPTDTAPERRLKLISADNIKSKRQKWMWVGRIPLGSITIFGGSGGEGKSTFGLYITSCIGAGTLDGDLKGQPAATIIISHEDDWGAVMVPRLKAAGADLSKVYQLNVETTVDELTQETIPALPMDLGLIRDAVEQTGAKLIIIDPITSTMDGDLNKVETARRALNPILALAQDLEIAVICIMHFNKGGGRLSDKLSGSHGFRDAVRSSLMFATEPDTGKRIVTGNKGNYTKDSGASFAFNLVSTEILTDDNETADVARVEYLGDTDLNVEEIINRGTAAPPVPGLTGNDMEQHIFAYLKEAGGSAPANDVMRDGKEQHGFKKDAMQVCRSRMTKPARIKSIRSGFGENAHYTWVIDSPMDYTDVSMPYMDYSTQEDVSHVSHVKSIEKRGNVTPLFPEAIEPESVMLDGFELTPPPGAADRLCIICSTSLAGRRRDTKTCSATCRKALSDQNKETS